MIAVVVISSAPVSLVGLAVTIGLAVVVAHWGAFRPQVKRCLAALSLAIVLGTIGAAVVHAEDDDFVMMNPCKRYTSADWQWWAEGCWLP